MCESLVFILEFWGKKANTEFLSLGMTSGQDTAKGSHGFVMTLTHCMTRVN